MDIERKIQENAEEMQLDTFFDDREEYNHLLSKFDTKRQKKLLRKIDWRLLPVLSLFYLISFMDRANIGNAKLQGLEEDLNLTPSEYNWYFGPFYANICLVLTLTFV